MDWDRDKINFLVQGFIGLLQVATVRKKTFCGFRCTIDLDAHRRWAEPNNIPGVAELCANFAFRLFSRWHADFPAESISPFEIIFDRGDPYLNVLEKKWRDREQRLKYPWWKLVNNISNAGMKETPPLQAADMLAWARYRL